MEREAQSGVARRGRRFERLLIVRLGSMGDIVHTLPAVATLRRAFPESRIDWVVEERWAELLASRPEFRSGPRCAEKPLVDNVYVVDTRAWRKQLTARATREAAASAVRILRRAHYDAAIDLQGALKSAFLMRLSGARARFGFSRPRESPAGLAYTRRAAARGQHVADQNISLVVAAAAAAGIAAEPARLFPLPVDMQVEAWADAEIARRGIGRFAVCTPSAGWGAKCWPAERYGEVARALARHGLRVLVNHGPGEAGLAEEVVEHSGGAAQSITCSIAQLTALSRRARLVIGGDTGPTHLAAALGIPVVAIYGPTDPARNGPLGGPAMVLRSERSVTSHARNKRTEEGMLEITADEVTRAARRLLAESIR